MKSRRRHSTSSEDSAETADSAESDSEASSGSEASESGSSEPARRHKKHKRRAESSASDSEATRRRAKKRKHKKKKKKHAKKVRRDEFDLESSASEPEERKHKHKHKHDKHKRKQTASRSPSVLEVPVSQAERGHSRGARVQSVVRGVRRSSSRERSRSPRPAARYYDYRHESARDSRSGSEARRRHRGSPGVEDDRFYRGSSRDASRPNPQPRYSEEERYERAGGGQDYDYYRNYTHRSVKYGHEEEYRGGGERVRDRGDHNGRPHGYAPDPRVRRAGDGPTCLVCGAVHAGRPCRAAPRRTYPEHDESVEVSGICNEYVLQLGRYRRSFTLTPYSARGT